MQDPPLTTAVRFRLGGVKSPVELNLDDVEADQLACAARLAGISLQELLGFIVLRQLEAWTPQWRHEGYRTWGTASNEVSKGLRDSLQGAHTILNILDSLAAELDEFKPGRSAKAHPEARAHLENCCGLLRRAAEKIRVGADDASAHWHLHVVPALLERIPEPVQISQVRPV